MKLHPEYCSLAATEFGASKWGAPVPVGSRVSVISSSIFFHSRLTNCATQAGMMALSQAGMMAYRWKCEVAVR